MLPMMAQLSALRSGGGMGLRDPNSTVGFGGQPMSPAMMQQMQQSGMQQPPPGGLMNKMGGGPTMKADGDGTAQPPVGDMMQRFDQNGNEINADGTPFIPPNDPGGGSGGGIMNGLPDWIRNQFGNFSGVMSNPLLGPSLAVALQQYHQSRQYTDMAEQYAHQLDPFGQQRGHYQDLLRQSYDDPSAVLQDPAYQKQLNFELDNLSRQNMAKGWGNDSGNMAAALSDRQHIMDEQHIQDYRKGLMPLTGEQFGPETAGRMLETGLAGRMGAENNAVGALMMPFLNQARNNTINNNNPNGPGGSGDPLTRATNLLKNPANLPLAMRNWTPQHLSEWLQFNHQLGNDPFGNWATGGSNGMDGGVSGADGEINPGNIILPGQEGGDFNPFGSGDPSGGYGPGYGDNPFGDGGGIDLGTIDPGGGGFDWTDPSIWDFGGP